jgi:SAM-dependent methyltransferase
MTNAEFDEFAENYEEALGPGLAWSGEGKDYFAERRVQWLAQKLAGLRVDARRVMDFGCGTGTATPFLREILGAETIIGVDVSPRSLEVARRSYPFEGVRFLTNDNYAPSGDLDLVYCNGVFHHIPPGERASAVGYVYRSLRPGGVFALWENNPWNPAMMAMMRLAPVDRNAVTLNPPESRALLRAGGLEVREASFMFLFPKLLGPLRALEPRLSSLPLGAQYLTLAIKH